MLKELRGYYFDVLAAIRTELAGWCVTSGLPATRTEPNLDGGNARIGDVNGEGFYPMLLAFQSVTPGHDFEFGSDCVLDGDYGTRLEFECREHRAKLVNRQWIAAVHQQIPTPIAYTNHEELDLEIR